MSKDSQYRAVNNYKRRHYRRVVCELPKEYYENVYLPYIKERNITSGGFIKRCIQYYIENNIFPEK